MGCIVFFVLLGGWGWGGVSSSESAVAALMAHRLYLALGKGRSGVWFMTSEGCLLYFKFIYSIKRSSTKG